MKRLWIVTLAFACGCAGEAVQPSSTPPSGAEESVSAPIANTNPDRRLVRVVVDSTTGVVCYVQINSLNSREGAVGCAYSPLVAK